MTMLRTRKVPARPTHPVVGKDEVVVWRCGGCDKFLFRAEDVSGHIELTCERCGRLNMVRV